MNFISLKRTLKLSWGEQTYWNICNICFNLSFHKPKKDHCETCIDFENTTLQQKIMLKEKYQTHLVHKTST